ncbi:MAG: DNA repair protein RadC [Nitrospirae bacterium]|nr:DNA repair protein RadC [Nitrospirota bacterium]
MGKEGSETPHYVGHRKRLRERYKKGGIDALTEYEPLELLLTYVNLQKDTKPDSKLLLKRFGSMRGVMDAALDDLTEVEGIGEQTALLIKLVKDFTAIYFKEKIVVKKKVSSPLDIIDYLKVSLGSLKDEQFMSLYLNSGNEIVALEVISEGTVNHAVVYPRKIFEIALKLKATAVILVHNHPGGSVKPSDQDIRLTKLLKSAADTLGIIIHDHLIVTGNSYLSFVETGLM